MSMTDRLEKMLAGGRDDPMIRFGLGNAYFGEDDDKAIVHLRACIEQDENYSAAYKLLGKALFKQQQYDEARDVFDRGLAVAGGQGDKQTEKEITVFLKKIDKEMGNG